MLILKKVAVTGGLACGKTSVCRILQRLGAYVISADEIVHKLLSPESPLSHQVIKLIGEDVVANGVIDRGALADKVFQQPDRLKSLERILHPAVAEEINKQYALAEKSLAPLFVAEVPLLFESGMNVFFDVVVTVTASEENAKKRFKDTSSYAARTKNQLPLTIKEERADFIIDNNGSLDNVEKQVKKLFTQLTH